MLAKLVHFCFPQLPPLLLSQHISIIVPIYKRANLLYVCILYSPAQSAVVGQRSRNLGTSYDDCLYARFNFMTTGTIFLTVGIGKNTISVISLFGKTMTFPYN